MQQETLVSNEAKEDVEITPSVIWILIGSAILGVALIYVYSRHQEGFWKVLWEAIGTALLVAALVEKPLGRVVAAVRRHDRRLLDNINALRAQLDAIQTSMQQTAQSFAALTLESQVQAMEVKLSEVKSTIGAVLHHVQTRLP